jgi:hypothetical protein
VTIARFVTEWLLPALICPCCGQVTIADAPPGVHPGTISYGPGVNTAAVLLAGYGKVPAERTAHLIGMLLGMRRAGGSIRTSGIARCGRSGRHGQADSAGGPGSRDQRGHLGELVNLGNWVNADRCRRDGGDGALSEDERGNLLAQLHRPVPARPETRGEPPQVGTAPVETTMQEPGSTIPR